MKKILLSVIMCLMLNTIYSQDKKIGFDSLWAFGYPEYINFQTALDSNVFIYSTYDKRHDMVFVFNEDSMLVKTYVNDSLVERSIIYEIVHLERLITYKTLVKVNDTICEGVFNIFFKDSKCKKLDILIGGYVEPDIKNNFICFNPYYINRPLFYFKVKKSK